MDDLVTNHLTAIGKSEDAICGTQIERIGHHLQDNVNAFPLTVAPVGEPSSAPWLGIQHRRDAAPLGLDVGGDLRQTGRNGFLSEVAIEDDHDLKGPHGTHLLPR